MTKQRALILKLIRESGGHMTADQIYQAAKKELPGIALATVYNNLIRLSEEGEIKKITFRDRTDRYDKSSIPHIHLVCDVCGGVCDHPSEGLLQEMERRLGFPIHEYELAIHYTCDQCK
ncbi:MAG: transcriptional repressor [Clostridia bacterium]|nr:transcriptional repressor [Clostridia bacterium]